MKTYLYRLGDGNEGCFPRFLVTIADEENPYAALAALVTERYRPGSSTRRYVMRNIETTGEPEYGISATVYEGPAGEQAFGSAWLCAELEPCSDADVEAREARGFASPLPFREYLDRGTRAWYARETRKRGV